MQIQSLMTPDPHTIGPNANLAEAAQLMFDHNCGILPVVDSRGGLQAVITDRDICIAAATRDRAPSQIQVSELARHTRQPVVTCGPHDDVRDALGRMRESHARRLPVVRDGKLVGLISLRDIASAVIEHRKPGVTADEVSAALLAVSRPVPQPASA